MAVARPAAATRTSRRSSACGRWVEEATWVVPGHGTPIDAQRALAILREDVAYLEALPDPAAPIPPARRTGAQRKIHEENLKRVSA